MLGCDLQARADQLLVDRKDVPTAATDDEPTARSTASAFASLPNPKRVGDLVERQVQCGNRVRRIDRELAGGGEMRFARILRCDPDTGVEQQHGSGFTVFADQLRRATTELLSGGPSRLFELRAPTLAIGLELRSASRCKKPPAGSRRLRRHRRPRAREEGREWRSSPWPQGEYNGIAGGQNGMAGIVNGGDARVARRYMPILENTSRADQ